MYHKIVSLKLKSVIFSQIYWQELSKSIIKKPTCFKVGFLFILGFSIFTKWLISILITSVVLCWDVIHQLKCLCDKPFKMSCF